MVCFLYWIVMSGVHIICVCTIYVQRAIYRAEGYYFYCRGLEIVTKLLQSIKKLLQKCVNFLSNSTQSPLTHFHQLNKIDNLSTSYPQSIKVIHIVIHIIVDYLHYRPYFLTYLLTYLRH